MTCYLVQIGSAGWRACDDLAYLWELSATGWPVLVKPMTSRFPHA